jgi:hypothetical protein
VSGRGGTTASTRDQVLDQAAAKRGRPRPPVQVACAECGEPLEGRPAGCLLEAVCERAVSPAASGGVCGERAEKGGSGSGRGGSLDRERRAVRELGRRLALTSGFLTRPDPRCEATLTARSRRLLCGRRLESLNVFWSTAPDISQSDNRHAVFPAQSRAKTCKTVGGAPTPSAPPPDEGRRTAAARARRKPVSPGCPAGPAAPQSRPPGARSVFGEAARGTPAVGLGRCSPT